MKRLAILYNISCWVRHQMGTRTLIIERHSTASFFLLRLSRSPATSLASVRTTAESSNRWYPSHPSWLRVAMSNKMIVFRSIGFPPAPKHWITNQIRLQHGLWQTPAHSSAFSNSRQNWSVCELRMRTNWYLQRKLRERGPWALCSQQHGYPLLVCCIGLFWQITTRDQLHELPGVFSAPTQEKSSTSGPDLPGEGVV